MSAITTRTLSELLADFVTRHGGSRATATALGTSRTAVHNWTSGNATPSSESLRRIEELLDDADTELRDALTAMSYQRNLSAAAKTDVAQLLADLVARHGGSASVARRLGVFSGSVRQWLNGTTLPSESTLDALATAFGDLGELREAVRAARAVKAARHDTTVVPSTRFAELLNAAIDANGGLKAAAAKIGVAAYRLRPWREGRKVPRPAVLTQLADALDIDRAALAAATGRSAALAPRATSGGFAEAMRELVAAHGGPGATARRAGVTVNQINAWCAGTAVPYVRTIVKVAGRLDSDLATLLAAAGKPPLAATRQDIAAAATASIPMRLGAWKSQLGLDTVEAAERLGMNRFEFSRIVNGSAAPTSVRRCEAIAAVIGEAPARVAAAYHGDDSAFVEEVARATTGAPAMLRSAVRAAGLDPNSKAHHGVLAAAAEMGSSRVAALLNGQRSATLDDAIRLHAAIGTGIAEVLVIAGCDPQLAERFEKAALAKVKSGPAEDVGSLLRAFRLVADRTMTDVAHSVGYSHLAALLRAENNETTPSPERLAALATELNIPLDRLFAAAGWTVRRTMASA